MELCKAVLEPSREEKIVFLEQVENSRNYILEQVENIESYTWAECHQVFENIKKIWHVTAGTIVGCIFNETYDDICSRMARTD